MPMALKSRNGLSTLRKGKMKTVLWLLFLSQKPANFDFRGGNPIFPCVTLAQALSGMGLMCDEREHVAQRLN